MVDEVRLAFNRSYRVWLNGQKHAELAHIRDSIAFLIDAMGCFYIPQ